MTSNLAGLGSPHPRRGGVNLTLRVQDMGPVRAITTCCAKSVRVSGHFGRPGHWWFTLFTIATMVLIRFGLDSALPGVDLETPTINAPLADTFSLLMLPATVAVTLRRLQGHRLPGWPAAMVVVTTCAISFTQQLIEIDGVSWSAWVGNILLVLAFILLIAALYPGTPGRNRYGPNSLEVTS